MKKLASDWSKDWGEISVGKRKEAEMRSIGTSSHNPIVNLFC